MRTQTLFINFDRLADAPGAPTVVRIAMVCNDLAIADSSMSRYVALSAGILGHMKRGGQLYFVKVSCGHLNEGLKAIENVRDNPVLSALVERCSPQTQSAFAALCSCLPRGSERQMFLKSVGWIRNRVAFHYDEKDIAWALRERAKRKSGAVSSITAGEDIHSTRFEFADDLLDTIVCRRLWEIPTSANLRSEADRIAEWCKKKCIAFLDFGGEFVLHFFREYPVK